VPLHRFSLCCAPLGWAPALVHWSFADASVVGCWQERALEPRSAPVWEELVSGACAGHVLKQGIVNMRLVQYSVLLMLLAGTERSVNGWSKLIGLWNGLVRRMLFALSYGTEKLRKIGRDLAQFFFALLGCAWLGGSFSILDAFNYGLSPSLTSYSIWGKSVVAFDLSFLGPSPSLRGV